jgi:hypothetical protein
MNLESDAPATRAIRAQDISQVNESATACAVSCYNKRFIDAVSVSYRQWMCGTSDDERDFGI